jgi:hypothetical protein
MSDVGTKTLQQPSVLEYFGSDVRGMYKLPPSSARHFWKLGSNYHEAAKLVFFAKEMPISNFPCYTLIGHALELYLKAYLRSKGEDINVLKKIGHNLKKVLERAEKEGLSKHFKFKSSDRECLNLFSLVYNKKAFDYPCQEERWSLPHHWWTIDFADRLSQCVQPFANRAPCPPEVSNNI